MDSRAAVGVVSVAWVDASLGTVAWSGAFASSSEVLEKESLWGRRAPGLRLLKCHREAMDLKVGRPEEDVQVP